jgi:hypothetical protein
MGTGGTTALGSPEHDPRAARAGLLPILSSPNFQRRTATNVVFLHICIEAQLPTG